MARVAAIALLGEQGWEAFAADGLYIWFKRPKQE